MTTVVILSQTLDRGRWYRTARAMLTVVAAALAIVLPAFAAANILFRPVFAEFEAPYVFVHHAHSVMWYEHAGARRVTTLRHCVGMAERGEYSQDCVNAWAAETAVGDHARIKELGAAADRDWVPDPESR